MVTSSVFFLLLLHFFVLYLSRTRHLSPDRFACLPLFDFCFLRIILYSLFSLLSSLFSLFSSLFSLLSSLFSLLYSLFSILYSLFSLLSSLFSLLSSLFSLLFSSVFISIPPFSIFIFISISPSLSQSVCSIH